MLPASPFHRQRFQSPPARTAPRTFSPAIQRDLTEARAEEKSSFGFAKVAIGLGLAAGALTACTNPVPPAADAGAYVLEDAEVVVLNDSIDRIDLARETHTECSGFGEDESCWEVDDAYHPIGIHMGHGIVQDLNGNLFAAPQLAADAAPGHAVANPDSVFVDGPLFTEGHLNKTSENTYQVNGSVFGGRYNIALDGKEALVTAPALFGGEYEVMKISNADGVNIVSEGRWDQQLVQSQGEHLLVQGSGGSQLGEIRHDKAAGSYSITDKGLFGGEYIVTADYSSQNYERSSNSWGATKVRVNQNAAGNHDKTINGGRADYTVTPDGQGWANKANGFLGSTIEYQISGGVTLPG